MTTNCSYLRLSSPKCANSKPQSPLGFVAMTFHQPIDQDRVHQESYNTKTSRPSSSVAGRTTTLKAGGCLVVNFRSPGPKAIQLKVIRKNSRARPLGGYPMQSETKECDTDA